MGTLARVLEENGLVTVALAQVRAQAERVAPPRALYAEFPLGRPLGIPGDAAFQRRVLDAAFALLDRDTGPVLEDFPDVIADEAATPLEPPMPPESDDAEAVDEARALRPAYERTLAAQGGRTAVGRTTPPDGIPDLLQAFVRVTEGVGLREAGFPSNPIECVMDVRAYYEEAALALAGHVPAARSSETWFYHHTAAGRTILTAREKLKESGAPQPVWFYMAPATYR